MKHVFSLLLLPGLLLAADEKPLSFAAIKPVAAVAKGAASDAPIDALTALRAAQSAKNWPQVVAAADALLALPGTETAQRFAWTEAKRVAFEAQGKWDEAVAASMSALAYPMASNTIQAVRMRVLRQLSDKLNRKDDAVRLAGEILADETVVPDWRADAALFAAPILCQGLKRPDDAQSLLLLADALPTSPRKRAQVRDRVALHYASHCKPPKIKELRAAHASIVTNAFFPADERVKAVCAYLDSHRKAKAATDKLAAVPFAEAFLANDAIPPPLAVRVRDAIFRNQREGGDRVGAKATAESLYADTNATVAIRIGAAAYLADQRVAAGDCPGAVNLLESCYALPRCGVADLETVARRIGGIYIGKGDLDAALKAYKDCLARNDSDDMRRRVNTLVLAAYREFFRYEDVRAFCLEHGNRIEAARISADLLDDIPGAERLHREILADEKESRSSRCAAWMWLFGRDKELTDRYLPFYLGATPAETNDAVKALTRRLCLGKENSAAFFGNCDEVIRIYGILSDVRKATGKTYPFMVMQYVAMAYCGVRDFPAAARVCHEALAQGSTKDAAELYQLHMMEALFGHAGDETALARVLKAADAKFAGHLEIKERLARLERIGACAVFGANEPLARALATYRKNLFVPMPKRRYVVHFSAEPIFGLGGWEKLKVRPEAQEMNRTYGGSMDFLATDVATGNRGEGIGAEAGKAPAAPPTIQIVCDPFGIHFRFESPDEKAAEIATGFLGGGSYEGYIAPGENQPYVCFLLDIAPNASPTFFNTTYNTAGHRRITADNRRLYRCETAFTATSCVSYVMFSWNAFATLIPDNGTVWEFENILWGRSGKPAWNGTESIHGRSSWGELVFDLPAKARLEILRRVIFAIRKDYLAEKRTGGSHEGVIDHWKDAVVGDPAFYAECVQPLVDRLDSYLALVKVDMSDDDVLKVADEALAGWRDIRFAIARLRARYLAEKAAGGSAEP